MTTCIDDASALDPREFRRVMGLFATGVTVITAAVEGQVHAMTANAVMSVSLDPLLVCVSVARRSRLNRFLDDGVAYTVNILREDQEALSTYFAGLWKHPIPPEHRFEPWLAGPRLAGCLAAIACRVHEVLDGGDHRLFLGRVIGMYQADGVLSPLLYFGGGYRRVTKHDVVPQSLFEV